MTSKMANALKGLQVLVVDDDSDVTEIMFLALGAAGAHVRTAGSAEEALALLETGWRPDVILSDLEMPGANGFELVELARKYPSLSEVPAIALSGALARTAEQQASGKFSRYLAKPTKLPDIVSALATAAAR